MELVTATRLRVRLTVFACVMATVFFLSGFQTSLRFTYAALNYIAAIGLAVMIPGALIWLVPSIRSPWGRWTVGCLSAIVSFPVAIFSLFASLEMGHVFSRGSDASFERISELRSANSAYRVYRTNGGATTSFGIVLRRETTLLPGLLLVTAMRGYYPAAEATLEYLPNGLARLTVAPDISEGRIQNGDTFEFRP